MQNSRGRVLYLDFRALLFWLECLFYILQRSFCSASASRQCFLSLWPIWPYCQHLFKLLQAFYCLLWRRFPYHRCTSLMWSNWSLFPLGELLGWGSEKFSISSRDIEMNKYNYIFRKFIWEEITKAESIIIWSISNIKKNINIKRRGGYLLTIFSVLDFRQRDHQSLPEIIILGTFLTKIN